MLHTLGYDQQAELTSFDSNHQQLISYKCFSDSNLSLKPISINKLSKQLCILLMDVLLTHWDNTSCYLHTLFLELQVSLSLVAANIPKQTIKVEQQQ